jgi:hypothetical protein
MITTTEIFRANPANFLLKIGSYQFCISFYRMDTFFMAYEIFSLFHPFWLRLIKLSLLWDFLL